MVIEIGRGCESLAANGTLMGFLSAVNPAVGVERTRRRESLIADVTNMRLFTFNQL